MRPCQMIFIFSLELKLISQSLLKWKNKEEEQEEIKTLIFHLKQPQSNPKWQKKNYEINKV